MISYDLLERSKASSHFLIEFSAYYKELLSYILFMFLNIKIVKISYFSFEFNFLHLVIKFKFVIPEVHNFGICTDSAIKNYFNLV